MKNDPNILSSTQNVLEPTFLGDMLCEDNLLQDQKLSSVMTSPKSNFDSFQNYFNSIYKKDKQELYESEEIENLDTKLAKLRGSYRKIIDLIKNDNTLENQPLTANLGPENDLSVIGSKQKSQLKKIIQMISPKQSPQYLFKDKVNYTVSSTFKTSNDEGKFASLSSNVVDIRDNSESSNTNLLNLFNNALDDKNNELKAKTSSSKENINIDYSKLSLGSTSNSLPVLSKIDQTHYRPKHICLNL